MRNDLIGMLERLLRGVLSRNRRRRGIGPLLLSVLVILTIAALQRLKEPDAPLPAEGTELLCKVGKVYDGDTLNAHCDEGKLKVRVYGIDAPEMGQRPWGVMARDMMREMVPADRVRLKVMDTDRYGRVVARVFAGDRDLGLALVRQGGAVVYERYNKSAEYGSVQMEARRARLGVWSEPGAQQEPWEWRRLNPRS